MKIKELRDSVKEKDSKVLENILVKVYKLLPKDKKEDADVLITDILSGKGKQKRVIS